MVDHTSIELIDTHCHIHFPDYKLDVDTVISNANKAGVTRLLCVGCSIKDSHLGVALAAAHDNVWASVGIHPHEASTVTGQTDKFEALEKLALQPKVVAIGECGLDYFYLHSPKDQQIELLGFQLGLAQKHHLPVVFHVRDAFDDFWPIFDTYKHITGVIHSFTATKKELSAIIDRGLYVGLNGIVTFSKNPQQLEAVKALPLENLVLETDAPFLTPTPYRGTINESKHVRVIAEFLSNLRGESIEQLAAATTHNAQKLFSLE